MSDFSSDANPYKPMDPTGGAPGGGTPTAGPVKMPGALMAVGIICIMFGFLGVAASCFGTVNAVVQMTMSGNAQDEWQEVMEDEVFDDIDGMTFDDGDPGGDEEAADPFALQQEMMQELQAAATKYAAANLVLSAVNLFLGGALGIGGVLLLCSKPVGRQILLVATLVAVLFVLARAGVQTFISLQMAPIMSKYMERMSEVQGGEMPGGLEMITNASLGVGICFTVVWALILAALYVWSHSYLRSKRVTDYFAAKTAM